MRILFLSTTFPDTQSPTRGTYNAALCQALAARHPVRVIAPRLFSEAIPRRLRGGSYTTPEDLSAAGVEVRYPLCWQTPKVLQDRYGEQMSWSIRPVLQKTLQEFQPEAILSYWAHPEGEVALRAAQQAGVPAAVIVGGSDVLILPQVRSRGKRVRHVLENSQAVITVSEGLRQSVCALGIPADQVHTVYQGIDTRRFHPSIDRTAARRKLNLSADCWHYVWVGRMVGVKSLDTLLEAVTILKNRGRKQQLHLLGDGPLRKPLEKLALRLGLGEQVCFEGAVSHDALPLWYAAADATVLCSTSEGLPNVLRESLACGTPFVSTDVGSIREISDEAYSAFVPPRSPLLTADALETILHSDYQIAARSYIAKGWDTTARQTADLLQNLIQRSSAESKNAPQQAVSQSVRQGSLT